MHTPTVSKQDNKQGPSLPRPLEIPKRSNTPSPLSKPMTMSPEASVTKFTVPVAAETRPQTPLPIVSPELPKIQSPAAKRLTELSNKGQSKSGKSRLRRALSFGSISELRGFSTPEDKAQATAKGPEMSRKQQLDQELGAEQAAIAQKQEDNGPRPPASDELARAVKSGAHA